MFNFDAKSNLTTTHIHVDDKLELPVLKIISQNNEVEEFTENVSPKDSEMDRMANTYHEEVAQTSLHLPVFSQHDEQWADTAYGTKTLDESGCGPTSLAMVLSYMEGQWITPPNIIKSLDLVPDKAPGWYYIEGVGTDHDMFLSLQDTYGYQAEKYYGVMSADKIQTALSEGKYVIAGLGKGPIYDGDGHFIVIRGTDEEGNFYISDPNLGNPEKENYFLTNQSYSYADLGKIKSLIIITPNHS